MECLANAAPPSRLSQRNNIHTANSLAKLSLGVHGHEIIIGECLWSLGTMAAWPLGNADN